MIIAEITQDTMLMTISYKVEIRKLTLPTLSDSKICKFEGLFSGLSNQ
jgi:hypothetical protein